jgi:hypothetical protein
MVKQIGELSPAAPAFHSDDPIRLARMVKQIGELTTHSDDPIRLARMVKQIGELS